MKTSSNKTIAICHEMRYSEGEHNYLQMGTIIEKLKKTRQQLGFSETNQEKDVKAVADDFLLVILIAKFLTNNHKQIKGNDASIPPNVIILPYNNDILQKWLGSTLCLPSRFALMDENLK